jgi:hypothetical protein
MCAAIILCGMLMSHRSAGRLTRHLPVRVVTGRCVREIELMHRRRGDGGGASGLRRFEANNDDVSVK